MRARHLLVASLALNLGLVWAWYHAAHRPVPPVVPPKIERPFNPFDHEVKTNVVVRRLNFTWHEVESADYVTYIKNLREIGCPEGTIRDIIVADVNQLYAHRREKEIQPPEFQWWKSELDPAIRQQNARKLRSMETERKAMLTRLLGPEWEVALQDDTGDHGGVNLNGPVLGDLSLETKQKVYDIVARAQQQARQLETGADANPIDPRAIARVRQESRAALAKVLNPEQLEEFLLRYSETAKRMREELRGLSLLPDEFRSLFRVRDLSEEQISLAGVAGDSVTAAAIDALEIQRDTNLRTILGSERYAIYKLNQDPLYRQAYSTTLQAGVNTNLVSPLYQINQVTEAEIIRIQNDNNLSPEEKSDAIIAAETDRQKSLERVLGSDAYQRLQSQQLLSAPGAERPTMVPRP
jgi:hypothetical protein